MSVSFNWHPVRGTYHAEAKEISGTIWVDLEEGKGHNKREGTFFFPTLSQARAVADGFNNPPNPETKGDPDGTDN